MKIKRVFANNRKKSFVVETKEGVFDFPYSQLDLKPSHEDTLMKVFVDPELASEGFTYQLESGKEDSILMDDVLYYNKDPEYLCELLLHSLTLQALEILKTNKLPKRELARRLSTSPRQIYRLLDPAFFGKTIDEMVKLFHAIGHKVELRVSKKAA